MGEADYLQKWMDFAHAEQATENELMSFVRAFGDTLLGDQDVQMVEHTELLEMDKVDGKTSEMQKLTEQYEFIKAAAMAIKRHNMEWSNISKQVASRRATRQAVRQVDCCRKIVIPI